MHNSRFTNGVVTFGLSGEERLPELSESLIAFLSPYFWMTETGDEQFHLELEDYNRLPASWLEQTAEPVSIRESTASAFNLKAVSFSDEDGSRIVIDASSRTAYHLQENQDKVVFYGSDQSHIHLYEFVRYVSLLLEEAAGTLLLHASGVIHNDTCLLVLGHKGAGKTSTLLHLISGKSWKYFSGDKVLVSENAEGGLLIRGWPDYPHIGIGTLKNYPAWMKGLGLTLTDEEGRVKPDSHKELIDPALFRKTVQGADTPAANQIAALIFPEINAEESAVEQIEEGTWRHELLMDMIEYPHEFAAVRWHRLLERNRNAARKDYSKLLDNLANVKWITVKGRASIPERILEPLVL